MTKFHAEFFEQMWDNLHTSVLVLDNRFNVVYANTSCTELLGQGLKRIQGCSFTSLFSYHSVELERIAKYTLEQGVDCHQHRADVVFVDSRHANLALNSRRIIYQQSAFLLLEVRQTDQEIKLDQASNQMHQHQAARTLIRNLAHEIKNPLGGIRGAAQLLQYEVDQQERDECAQLIINQADRLRELVDRLLGPNQRLHKQATNIHQTLESVLKLCTLDNNKVITLKKDYDPSIPDVVVDSDKIQQVLLNIVRNATQALSEGGEIAVQTRVRYHLRRHDKTLKKALQIKIVDNGPGIAPEIRETLFYPMVSNKEGGSGLGLSIAQTLIDQHQGFIECDSWPGHTEFTLYLPL